MDNQPSPTCVKGRLDQGPADRSVSPICRQPLHVCLAHGPLSALPGPSGCSHSLRLSPNSPMGAWPSLHPWLGVSGRGGGQAQRTQGHVDRERSNRALAVPKAGATSSIRTERNNAAPGQRPQKPTTYAVTAKGKGQWAEPRPLPPPHSLKNELQKTMWGETVLKR